MRHGKKPRSVSGWDVARERKGISPRYSLASAATKKEKKHFFFIGMLSILKKKEVFLFCKELKLANLSLARC